MAKYKSDRSNACDFDLETKKAMLKRDKEKCIFCPSRYNLTPAHYISRGSGGLGILENGACVCIVCHNRLDHSTERKYLLAQFKEYLDMLYPDFKDVDRIYDRRKDWYK